MMRHADMSGVHAETTFINGPDGTSAFDSLEDAHGVIVAASENLLQAV